MADVGGSMEMALERERKYTLPPSGLPDLSVLGPVSQPRTLQLAATYLDTPELALFEEGATLRRRSGGDDDGWHLKSAAGDGARLERRMPTGTLCRVPGALRDAVREAVADRPLLPVLQLDTRRTVRRIFDGEGGVRAEICVDKVRARLLIAPWTRVTWCEAEAELAADEPPATLEEIDGFLRERGLKPARHSSKAQRMLRDVSPWSCPDDATAADAVRRAVADQLGKLQSLETEVGRDEPEAVHDTRVAMRRLRSILGAFGMLLATADEIRAVRDELRWAGLQLSGARDLEVLDELLGQIFDEVGREACAPVVAAWRARVAAGPETTQAAALQAIASPRWDAMHGRLVDLAASEVARGRGDRPARAELRRRAGRVIAKLERWRAVAESDPGGEAAWHEVRKAAKGVRYAHEVLAGLPDASKRDRGAPEVWKAVTTSLGNVQDVALAREAVAALRPGRAADEAFDAVDAALAARADVDLAEARSAMAEAL